MGFSKSILKILSKRELNLLENEILIYILREFRKIFQIDACNAVEWEAKVFETSVLRGMLCEILATGEYTLQGIAFYTGFHEDAIHDVASGLNSYPSIPLFYRLVELHRLVRKDRYESVRQKLLTKLYELHQGITNSKVS